MADAATPLSRLAESARRLTDAEAEQLRTALNLLFTESFLIRSIDAHAGSYRFVMANRDLVEQYLEVAGWGIRADESLGVVSFTGPASARLNLKKDETILALVLRLLYEEKAGEIALHGERTVRRSDIQEKLKTLAVTPFKKTRFLSLLRRFQSIRLIRVVGEESDPDATVVLHPSLAFALDAPAIETYEARLAELVGPSDEEE